MKALIFGSVQEARDRSREAWEAHLGRKKNPEDVTEFLWDVVEHPEDGRAVILLEENEKPELTTAEEKAVLVEKAAVETEGWFPKSEKP